MLDPLTLDQMRIFATVADAGSFSAAARRLGRAQSAISQSVQAFESHLGVTLFDRTGRTPKLTSAGRVLLDQVLRVLGDVDALKARADSISQEAEPELTIAVDQVLPSALLMQSLTDFRQRFPEVAVTMFTEGLGGTERRLRDRLARMAIYSPVSGSSRGLEIEFLTLIPIVPVVAADHPLAATDEMVERSTLTRHVQLVLTDRTQTQRGLVMGDHTWRFADQHSRLDYLLNGFGWSFMPYHLVETQVANRRLKILRLRELGDRLLTLPLYIVREHGCEFGPAGRWLLADLRTRLAETEHAAFPRAKIKNSIRIRLGAEATRTELEF